MNTKLSSLVRSLYSLGFSKEAYQMTTTFDINKYIRPIDPEPPDIDDENDEDGDCPWHILPESDVLMNRLLLTSNIRLKEKLSRHDREQREQDLERLKRHKRHGGDFISYKTKYPPRLSETDILSEYYLLCEYFKFDEKYLNNCYDIDYIVGEVCKRLNIQTLITRFPE